MIHNRSKKEKNLFVFTLTERWLSNSRKRRTKKSHIEEWICQIIFFTLLTLFFFLSLFFLLIFTAGVWEEEEEKKRIFAKRIRFIWILVQRRKKIRCNHVNFFLYFYCSIVFVLCDKIGVMNYICRFFFVIFKCIVESYRLNGCFRVCERDDGKIACNLWKRCFLVRW